MGRILKGREMHLSAVDHMHAVTSPRRERGQLTARVRPLKPNANPPEAKKIPAFLWIKERESRLTESCA